MSPIPIPTANENAAVLDNDDLCSSTLSERLKNFIRTLAAQRAPGTSRSGLRIRVNIQVLQSKPNQNTTDSQEQTLNKSFESVPFGNLNNKANTAIPSHTNEGQSPAAHQFISSLPPPLPVAQPPGSLPEVPLDQLVEVLKILERMSNRNPAQQQTPGSNLTSYLPNVQQYPVPHANGQGHQSYLARKQTVSNVQPQPQFCIPQMVSQPYHESFQFIPPQPYSYQHLNPYPTMNFQSFPSVPLFSSHPSYPSFQSFAPIHQVPVHQPIFSTSAPAIPAQPTLTTATIFPVSPNIPKTSTLATTAIPKSQSQSTPTVPSPPTTEEKPIEKQPIKCKETSKKRKFEDAGEDRTKAFRRRFNNILEKQSEEVNEDWETFQSKSKCTVAKRPCVRAYKSFCIKTRIKEFQELAEDQRFAKLGTLTRCKCPKAE